MYNVNRYDTIYNEIQRTIEYKLQYDAMNTENKYDTMDNMIPLTI